MLEGRRVSGEKIRQARLRVGLTQAELARAVGVSERNIVRWENDRHQPRLEYVLRIAEVCRVHVVDLLDDGPDKDKAVTREQAAMDVGFAVERLLSVQP